MRNRVVHPLFRGRRAVLPLVTLVFGTACASGGASPQPPSTTPRTANQAARPSAAPDARVGLRGGLLDAEEAISNLRIVSKTVPPERFIGVTNSDLAFLGNYVIQGNYNGFIIWDITDPRTPTLVRDYLCPASQSDVSVYRNLLFVSGEGMGGRLDCGTQGVSEAVSADRLRGIRIFDISDIRNPQYIANVQTCRGSHTHSLLVDPNDSQNVYIYVSGSAPVRPAEEMPGCVSATPDEDPNSSMFRIEVIRVPLSDPARAAIVNSPRIFEGLTAPPTHGMSPADLEEIEAARARGAFIAEIQGQAIVLPAQFTGPMLDSIARARGAATPTAADSATLRAALPEMIARMIGAEGGDERGPRRGPNQCHDITLYPEIGLAGGACEGYGLLLDIRDPANPRRLDAVADSNFAYWHSATFNNDGTKILFTDEWGGGGQPKCRASDPMEWGANAIFTLENGRSMRFRSYYKLPAPQESTENCVAHNGSLIPIPGRDVMVQSWYQGGISIFDWTDAGNPVEIAYFDRGPIDTTRMVMGGSWSVYWYNGVIVSSEIARGLDVLELTPSEFISQNEIDAAKTVRFEYLNAQGQPKLVWPPSFALARAYLDQLERSNGLTGGRISGVRETLTAAERASGSTRHEALTRQATELEADVAGSRDPERVRKLIEALRALATTV